MSVYEKGIFIPTEALDLPDVEIISSALTRDNEIVISVESTKKEIPCHQCGCLTAPHGKGRTVRLRHLPILGKKTYIEITPLRGICPYCSKSPTTTQQASWYERKSPHTKAYERYILLSIINSTVTDVSIKEDLGYHAIEGIIDRRVESEVDWKRIKSIGLLGLDEISLKKGRRNFVTIVTSRTEETRILAVLKGREKETVKAFLMSIPKSLQKTIAGVCSDMYDGFVNAAKEVFGPKMPIIVDRFHVAKLYRECIRKLRSKELKCLKKTLSAEEYKKLKPAIRIMCQNKSYLTHEEQKVVEPLFQKSPLLRLAYRLCGDLTSIYNSHVDPATAHQKLNAWIQEVEASDLLCYQTFIGTLQKYRTEIENYFLDRNTSGFVEGVNNKIKVMKRRCYGITNLKHFYQRLILDFSGYAIFLDKLTQPIFA
jgi:transposase